MSELTTTDATASRRAQTGAGLRASVRARRDQFELELELDACAGDVVALVGPNGAGKTTALRALAGLTPLTGGRVEVDGVALEDSARGLRTPAERRPVGVVFQDHLLFPHLSALDNVAFGLRCRPGADGARRSRRAARQEAADWLARLGLADLASARPGALSGGQAQRVALARALATRPRLLLLDEPLAALDAGARLDVRAALRAHLAAFDGVSVLVTHDPLDAMALANRIVVVEHGRAAQQGTPAEVARRPRTDYVARLVGLNLCRGVADGSSVTLADGRRLAVAEALRGEVFVAFRPAAVALSRRRPPTGASADNQWAARIDGIESHGDTVRVSLAGPVRAMADITPLAAAELDLTPGSPVWATAPAAQLHAYPA